jgi:hypothetical protein
MAEVQEIETSGYGEFDYMNGSIYIGEWETIDKSKKRHGHGKFIHSLIGLTEEYDGEWNNDQMEGYGIYKYLSGARYEGDWVKNRQHGEGTYFFTNGSKYTGQWENHKMSGRGVYTDPYGVVWEGVFINGTFDSTIQKRLKAEYEEEQKIISLRHTASAQISEIKKVFSMEKKTWKENLGKFIVSNLEDVDRLVGEPYARWEDRNGDKWNDIINQILEVEPRILKNKEDSKVLGDRVFANQLQGAGQILEFIKQTDTRKIELALVCSESGKWVIVACTDIAQKP